ncbi:hypothetical protein NLJ89_g9148 [Agrocybe chaxingu]|uniref:Uncharacterized protein n=1 Tax=Agrocybe chaxingu TaxID=84603 RepID=A0A9W8MQ53_9AGAR|nr:hypothetical protein NLJ89_g9148 [Agrocybe chaxingu]
MLSTTSDVIYSGELKISRLVTSDGDEAGRSGRLASNAQEEDKELKEDEAAFTLSVSRARWSTPTGVEGVSAVGTALPSVRTVTSRDIRDKSGPFFL